MEALIVFIILYLLVVFVMVRSAREEKRRLSIYRSRLISRYGSFSDEICSRERLDYLSKNIMPADCGGIFGETDMECQYIDDISWNDLELDRIFESMNYTQTSSGEQLLYSLLRQPVISGGSKRAECMDRHAAYMMEHEAERTDFMMRLHMLGKTGSLPLKTYLDAMESEYSTSNIRHYICLSALIISFALIFVKPTPGMALFIFSACMNTAMYLKEKNRIAPYLKCFSYIMRMFGVCLDILSEKTQDGSRCLSEIYDRLDSDRDFIISMKKRSRRALSIGNGSSNAYGVIADYFRMFTHADIISFNKMVKEIVANKEKILFLTQITGYIDVVLSIAYYRAALDEYCVPKTDVRKRLEIINGFHPCVKNPVKNSVSQSKGMLITGSNASGKSTFLKMTAINVVLAQTIYTCACSSYRACAFRIYSSMALRDSIDAKESYYMAEIKALKRILNAACNEDEAPVICFVDEVLRGTNTVERICASTQILKWIAGKNALCFAATHDIELTHFLEGIYDNYHFEERIIDNDIEFPYVIYEGRSSTRNAIKLLEFMGFSEEITREAYNMAKELT